MKINFIRKQGVFLSRAFFVVLILDFIFFDNMLQFMQLNKT